MDLLDEGRRAALRRRAAELQDELASQAAHREAAARQASLAKEDAALLARVEELEAKAAEGRVADGLAAMAAAAGDPPAPAVAQRLEPNAPAAKPKPGPTGTLNAPLIAPLAEEDNK